MLTNLLVAFIVIVLALLLAFGEDWHRSHMPAAWKRRGAKFVTLHRAPPVLAAELPGENLVGARFVGADLHGSSFSFADLRGADLRGANLEAADLSHCDLRTANLAGADLTDADLTYADLRDATLDGATITGVKLRSTKTQGWQIDGLKCEYVFFALGDPLLRYPPDHDFADGEFKEELGGYAALVD